MTAEPVARSSIGRATISAETDLSADPGGDWLVHGSITYPVADAATAEALATELVLLLGEIAGDAPERLSDTP